MGDPNQSFDPTKAPTSQTQNNLADTIGKELFESAQKTTKSLFPARIYRVPKDFREFNKSAYIPRIISIGPLHCKEADLQKPMQDVKKHYAYCLFSRLTEGMNNDYQKCEKKTKVLLECVEKMQQCVDRAKKYYAEELKLDDADMVKMMLVDGCFILELLYASYHTNKSKAEEEKTTNGRDSGNPKASSSVQKTIDGGEDGSKSSSVGELPWNSKMIKQDLILLENQIPFFVLEDLFKLIVDEIPDPEENKLSLTEYVLKYFDNIWRPRRKLVETRSSKTKTCCCLPDECVLCIFDSTKENENGEEESRKANDENGEEESMKANDYYHILHFLHKHYLPSKQKTPTEKKSELDVSASELHYAGVKFVSVEALEAEGDINLFDVNFREPKFLFWGFFSARFEIPTLDIDGPTEPLLRNLIALEQCCPAVDQYYTSYAKFMDILISSEEDVKVLKKAKVIRNHLGKDKDVCCLFNNLCKDVVIGEFYFEDQCREAYRYSQHGWPKWRAYWKRTYVESPWGIVAFSVAIIWRS